MSSAIYASVAALAILATACGSTATQAQTPPRSTAGPFVELRQRSTILSELRTLLVALPAGYDSAQRRFPVLILLDADDDVQFRAAIANVAFLAAREAIPPMIVMGVVNGSNRTRDLTPDSLQLPPGMPKEMYGGLGGEGDRFLDYLEEEALPLVRQRFRTAPYTVFAGHSFGGLMGLQVAGARPSLAHAVVAMSPSLWVNDERPTARYVSRIAARTTPLRLFTTRGGNERSIDVPGEHFERELESAIAASGRGAIQYRHQRYPASSHAMTPQASLIDGLTSVFADYSMSTTGFDLLDPAHIDSAALVGANAVTSQWQARRQTNFPAAMMGTAPQPLGFADPASYLASAPLYGAFGQRGAGILLLRGAAEAYPNHFALRLALAEMRLSAGDTVNAAADVQRAGPLARTPKEVAAHVLLAKRLRPTAPLPAPGPRR